MLFLFLVWQLMIQNTATPGFQWVINCHENIDGQNHIWVGYISNSETSNSYLAYTGNGPGIYMTSFEVGEHNRVIDVLTDYGDVTLFHDPDHESITISSETVAPDCSEGAGMQSGHLDKDDQGVINDPRLNKRANSCYTPGQICTEQWQWEQGYKLIREGYAKFT